MGRPPRLDPLDIWHHVWGRGIGRRAIFETRRDIRYFLACVARAVRRGEIEVHGFVCMTTHFHLLVRSRNGRLAHGLRRILNAYSRYFNRSRDRDGTLYKSRFSSKRVDSAAYRRVLLRYIDRNPVAAGMVISPPDYPYGSARCFTCGRIPPWLNRAWVDSQVRVATGLAMSEGGRYEEAFPFRLTDAQVRLAEARQRSAALDVDTLDDLLASSPAGMQQWFAERARMADATSPSHPLVDAETVLAHVTEYEQRHGDFRVYPRRQGRSGVFFLRVMLLRALAGETQAQIARRLGISKATAHAVLSDHARVAESHPAYLGAADDLIRAILAACFSS